MSNKKRKPNSKPRKPGNKPASSESKQAEANSGKQHLNPAVAALIAIPVLVVVGIVVWSLLPKTPLDNGNGEVSVADEENNFSSTAVAEGSATRATANSNRLWDDDSKQKDTWLTEAERNEAWNEIDNPEADGWQTEAYADRVTEQFNKIKKLIISNKPIDADSVSKFVDESLSVKTLLPKSVESAFEDERIHVRRGVFDSKPETQNVSLESGDSDAANELAKALNEILQPYSNRKQLEIKLKVFRVEKSDESLVTHQTLEIYGPTETGVREENAVWIAEWNDVNKPRLTSIRVSKYESCDLLGGPMFTDVTESALSKTKSFREQLLKGYSFWLDGSQVDNTILGNNGIAVADVNGDGLEDIYLCQEANLPNLLYLQNPDGTLRDASKESGTDWLQNSSAALIVDLNNDGHQDLAVAFSGGVVIAEGDSSGKFSLRTVVDTADNIWSMTAADYDRDGLLDLYVGAHLPDGAANVSANIVLTDSDEFANGGKNSLLRNESDSNTFRFRDVTEECGLLQNNFRFTFAAAWEDYDNDGDQDLYVANDFGWNNFYRNELQADGSIKFVDIAVEANARDDAFGMSVNWADFDRDGWMDVYISNMYSYAGNRITFQKQFKSDTSDTVKERYQRYARGNTLLRNQGATEAPSQASEDEASSSVPDIVKFEDRSMETAVNMGRWAWGSCFVDLNNDGWEDLFVTNGYITGGDNGDL